MNAFFDHLLKNIYSIIASNDNYHHKTFKSNMNTKFYSVALLAVLSLAAAGCQKENIDEVPTQVTSLENQATVMYYYVDGVLNIKYLQDETEYRNFIYEMLTLSEQGHTVAFYKDSDNNRPNCTKDVVHYSTTNKDDAYKWANKMIEDGYRVQVTFDEETGKYNCIAYK